MVFYPIIDKYSKTEVLAKLKDSKIIIPTVSFANVPQLAIDLLISNLDTIKIGRLDDQYVYPFISSIDPPVSSTENVKIEGVCTSLEVYYSEKYNLTLLQQRSPILPEFKLQFLTNVLVPFLTDIGKFQEIVVLNSENLVSNYDDYITNNISIYYSLDLLDVKFKLLEINDANNNKNQIYKDISQTKDQFVKAVHQAMVEKDAINTNKISSIVIHVFEGDNFQDGVYFYQEILKFCEIASPHNHQLVKPYSWLGFYGDKPIPSSIEEGIFG